MKLMGLSPILILSAIFVGGCEIDLGLDDLGWEPEWEEPGYYIADELLIQLQVDFEEEAVEEQSSKSFSELSIVFVPLDLSYSAQFTAPNQIEIPISAYSYYWKMAVRQFLQDSTNSSLFTPGMFISQDLIDQLALHHQEVKSCTGFADGEIHELAIWLTTPVFSYPDYDGFFRGSYTTPNTILLGSILSDKHEFTHWLFWLNTEIADRNHESPFFKDCI